MNSLLKPGLAIKAKATLLNKACGINSNTAQGHVCKASPEGISVYIQRGNSQGWIEAVMTPEAFAHNFEADFRRADNAYYNLTKHYSKRYPEDFMRR